MTVSQVLGYTLVRNNDTERMTEYKILGIAKSCEKKMRKSEKDVCVGIYWKGESESYIV